MDATRLAASSRTGQSAPVPPDDYDPSRLSEAWTEVDASLAAELEGELRREMTKGHQLAGTALTSCPMVQRF